MLVNAITVTKASIYFVGGTTVENAVISSEDLVATATVLHQDLKIQK